jgi:alanine racemase
VTLRLSVDRTAWERHVAATAERVVSLVPVVKGNGYGFTRPWLARRAAELAPAVAVGTVWEVADVPAGCTPLVLTPTLHLPADLRADAVLAVGAPAHVEALSAASFRGRVTVKLRSSMQRHGVDAPGVAPLERSIGDAGLELDGYMLHLPLAGDDAGRVTEVEGWLSRLPADVPLSLSHLAPATFDALRRRHPERTLALRSGTGLWHGDKSALHLEADVIDRRSVDAGTVAGYRWGAVAERCELLLVGAGTAHGVTPLPDGRSPFHFARRRLDMHEPPHMHTSMVVDAGSAPLPAVGGWVDVQRPLTAITADVVVWS